MAERRATIWTRSYCILFLINMLLAMTTYMTNTSMQLHLRQLGIVSSLAGSLIGAMSLSSMFTRPFSGWICDHFNQKKLLTVFIGLTGCCLFGYGLAGSAPAIMALRILHGVSFGMTTTVTMAWVASVVPVNRMSEGMGCFALGQSIATAIGPTIGLFVLNETNSRVAFFCTSALILLCLVLLIFLPATEKTNKQLKSLKEQLKWNNFIAREALLFAALTVAIAATNGIETSYISSYAQTLGLNNAGWYFTISAVGLFFSRAILGKVTDRIGFGVVFFGAVALIGTAFLLLGTMNASTAVYTLAVAAAIKAVGIGAVQPGLQAMCVKSAAPEKRGAASSTYYIGADLGNGLSTIIGGNVLADYGYSAVFLTMQLPLALSALVYTIALTIKKRGIHS